MCIRDRWWIILFPYGRSRSIAPICVLFVVQGGDSDLVKFGQYTRWVSEHIWFICVGWMRMFCEFCGRSVFISIWLTLFIWLRVDVECQEFQDFYVCVSYRQCYKLRVFLTVSQPAYQLLVGYCVYFQEIWSVFCYERLELYGFHETQYHWDIIYELVLVCKLLHKRCEKC